MSDIQHKRPGLLTRAARWGRRVLGLQEKSISLSPYQYPLTVGFDYRSNDPAWARVGLSAEGRHLTDSVWVYACCRLIAGAVTSIPLVVRDQRGQIHRYHPLLALLDEPTPDSDYIEWATRRVYNLLLTGTDYLELHFYEGSHGAEPMQMWPYPEGIYRTETQDLLQGRPLIQCYRRMGEEVPKDKVVRTAYVSPTRWHQGLAPAAALAVETLADKEAATWQASSYSNRLLPDGVFTVPTDDMEQLKKFTEYMRTAWMNAKNAHMPIVMGGGVMDDMGAVSGSRSVSYQRIAQTALEADFVNSRSQGMERITAGFGVPDVLFKASAATFANLPAARRWFWETTVVPLASMMLGPLNRRIAPYYRHMAAGPVSIEMDLTDVPALAPVFDEKLDRAKKMIDLGVPPAQVNRRLDLGFEAWDGWDHSRVGPGGARFPLNDVARPEAETDLVRAEIEALRAELAVLPTEEVE